MSHTLPQRNISRLRHTLCAVALAACGIQAGEQPSDLQEGSATAQRSEHFQRFSALPVLGYSEETRLQYGAMTLLFFEPCHTGGKVNEIDLAAYGSTRGQFQFQVTPYAYLIQDKVSVTLDFRYQNWVGSYFGMGNDVDFDDYVNYDRERLLFSAEVQSSVGLPPAFKYGLKIHYENSAIDFDDCERDCSVELPDVHPGWRNGIGYQLAYDTRDNTNWAVHGFLVQWQQIFFDNHLGDYTFDTESLDLRGYTPLFWNISMATSALWQRAGGDVPFDMLSGPDGIKRFRGVESLYFRDSQGLTLQAEFRKYLGWRLAGDIFFEGSKVGDHFSELMRNQWHQAIGFGGMLALNLKERLYARGEFSLIDYKKLGMTVYIRSAF